MEKISILMSVYNGAAYIIEQLQSLSNQTRKPDEVIIIDDCSSDDTVLICTNYIHSNNLNSTWKVIKNEKNRGWKYNFHYGLTYTSGDYIMFCDQDDIWLPDKVEKACAILAGRNDFDAVATSETLWYANGHQSKSYADTDEIEVIDISRNTKDIFIRCSGCTMVVRKSFIDKTYNYFVETWAHDLMVWQLAGLNGRMALYHHSSILHRIHNKNVSRQQHNRIEDRKEDTCSSIKNLEAFKKYILEHKNEASYEKILSEIDKRIAGNQLRIEFMSSKSILKYLKLICKYRTIYRRKRQMIGDLVFTFMQR